MLGVNINEFHSPLRDCFLLSQASGISQVLLPHPSLPPIFAYPSL